MILKILSDILLRPDSIMAENIKNPPIMVKVCVIRFKLRCASEVVNGLLKIPLAVKAYSPGRGVEGVQGEMWVISIHYWGRHGVHPESRLHWMRVGSR